MGKSNLSVDAKVIRGTAYIRVTRGNEVGTHNHKLQGNKIDVHVKVGKDKVRVTGTANGEKVDNLTAH